MSETDLFTQKRIEIMIDMANKKVHQEIAQLKKTVRQLEEELIVLRKKSHSNSIQIQPAAIQGVTKPQTMPVAAPQSVQPKRPVTQQTTQAAPRYGKYTSEDVSIEKFFNFSGGRSR